jgi:hypothetical protein
MLDRLKRTLVESYVGAIALGWLLATAVLDFVSIFTAPIQVWVSGNEYRALSHNNGPVGLHLQDALPAIVKTFLVLLIWYFLFRWLYLKPVRAVLSEPASNPEQPR